MIDRAVGILREVCGEIIIVTNEPLDYLDLDATVVTDIFKGKGPWRGSIPACPCPGSAGLVCACDMPYLDASFIRHLAFLAEGYDIVVPSEGGVRSPSTPYTTGNACPSSAASGAGRTEGDRIL